MHYLGQCTEEACPSATYKRRNVSIYLDILCTVDYLSGVELCT